jgi:catalase
MNETDRAHLIENICGSLGGARRDIQEKMVKLFYKIDPEYGERIAKGLGIPAQLAKI